MIIIVIRSNNNNRRHASSQTQEDFTSSSYCVISEGASPSSMASPVLAVYYIILCYVILHYDIIAWYGMVWYSIVDYRSRCPSAFWRVAAVSAIAALLCPGRSVSRGVFAVLIVMVALAVVCHYW